MAKKNQHWVEMAGGAVLLTVAMVWGGGIDELRAVSATRNQSRMVEQSNADVSISDKTAQDRYRNGCALIVLTRNQKPVALSPDLPVVDPISKMPLPANTIVCDLLGNTARLVDGGIPSDIHFTGNSELVAEVAKRQGLVLSGGTGND